MLGAGLFIWYRVGIAINDQNLIQTKSATDGLSATQVYVGEISTKANEAAVSGDITKANGVYDDAIASSKDNTEKANLYSQKASTALGAGQIDEALTAALKAVELDGKSFEGLYVLAVVYQTKGDNAKAAEYYRKVAAIVTEPNEQNPASYGKQYYLDLATELEK